MNPILRTDTTAALTALALVALPLPASGTGTAKSCLDFANAGETAGVVTDAAEVIGAATMEGDGTLVLMLRAQSPGATGDALLRYPVTHPQYAEICRHLGGIRVGESKHVRAFPPSRQR